MCSFTGIRWVAFIGDEPWIAKARAYAVLLRTLCVLPGRQLALGSSDVTIRLRDVTKGA